MTLFRWGAFRSHSGRDLDYKIDCDALTREDLGTLAHIIRERIGPYSLAIGVPSGGDRLAVALNRLDVQYGAPLLIVDDVLTTGASMEETRKLFSGDIRGVVIFARGECPQWVWAVFRTWS